VTTALDIKERILGPDHPEVGVLLNNLAVSHRQSGQPDVAAAAYQRALPILTAALGRWRPTVIACDNNLAALTEQPPTCEPR
jgi:hypothetical protein